MPKLTDREALKRIDWLLHNRGDVLGRVTIRDHDLISLRQVLRLAEIGLRHKEQEEPRPLPGCGGDNLSD